MSKPIANFFNQCKMNKIYCVKSNLNNFFKTDLIIENLKLFVIEQYFFEIFIWLNYIESTVPLSLFDKF